MAKIFRTEELQVNGDNIRLTASIPGVFEVRNSSNQILMSNADVDSDVSSLQFKDRDLDSDISSLQFKDEDLDSDVSSLQFKDEDLDSDVSSLQFKDEDLDSDVSSLQFKDEDLDSDVSSLQFKGADLDSDISSLQFKDEDLDSDVSSLQNNNKDLSADVSSLSNVENQRSFYRSIKIPVGTHNITYKYTDLGSTISYNSTPRIFASLRISNLTDVLYSFSLYNVNSNSFSVSFSDEILEDDTYLDILVKTDLDDLGRDSIKSTDWFAPKDITTENTQLALWLDSSDSSTITSFDNSVSKWGDKSGRSIHLYSKNGAGYQPVIAANGLNGNNTIRTYGLETMESDSSSLQFGEMFIVCKWSGTSDSWDNSLNGLVAGLNDTADIGNGNILYGSSSDSDAFGNLSLFNGEFYLNGERISEDRLNRVVLPALSGSLGGVINARVLSSFGSAFINGIGLGFKGFDEGIFHWKGDYAEIIFYDELLSEQDRLKVEGYLSYKWGIQSLLPDLHPYKNERPVN